MKSIGWVLIKPHLEVDDLSETGANRPSEIELNIEQCISALADGM